MSDLSTTSWSETDASNNQFPPEGWPAGMFPNAVEPSARMNMGAMKRFWTRINPVYAATLSTTDSYVWSPSVALTGYGLRERIRLRMPSANTSTSPNMLASSLPAQPIKKYDGKGALINLSVGDIQAQDHGFWWDGTQIILENPIPVPFAIASPSTYTPTDQSGAGLSFTNVAGNYCQIGSIVFAYGTLTFPATGNGANVSISLPVAVPNQSYASVAGSISTAGSSGAFTPGIVAVKNTATFALTNAAANAGALQSNATFSGATITFMLIYPAS